MRLGKCIKRANQKSGSLVGVITGTSLWKDQFEFELIINRIARGQKMASLDVTLSIIIASLPETTTYQCKFFGMNDMAVDIPLT